MPQDLFEHYIKARKNTYAGDAKPAIGLTVPGSKGFRYHEADSPYYYQDEYFDRPERPGNFGGYEVNRRDSCDGKELTLYTYGGGLTEEELQLGEKAVYSKLTKFLEDHVSKVRFGKKVRFTIEDNDAVWAYEGDGEVGPWG